MEYGLIGEKLGHSFSKEIHEELADYQYDICPLTKEEFPEFMKKKEFKAINVTIPYKKMVLPYLSELDENAQKIGAVNTIVNQNGKLIGHNTDFSGFLYMLRRHHLKIEGKKTVVLGNGGAAQAILAVLRSLNASDIIIVDINHSENSISYEECFSSHMDAQLLINTSPIGMFPNIEASPVDLKRFPNCEAVLDIIYNPLTTQLVKQANALGMLGINGLEMLVAQAKYAVEFFLDQVIDDSIIEPIYHKIYKKMDSSLHS